MPIEGEDRSYVLYGSGGCSLYDTAKLRQLGALDPRLRARLCGGPRPRACAAGSRAGRPCLWRARVLHRASRHHLALLLARSNSTAFWKLNYLRFLARTIADPAVFRRLWEQAIGRLNLLASATAIPIRPRSPLCRKPGACVARAQRAPTRSCPRKRFSRSAAGRWPYSRAARARQAGRLDRHALYSLSPVARRRGAHVQPDAPGGRGFRPGAGFLRR